MAGIGVLKGVKVAICGIKCIGLTKEAIKIFGVFFSYDKNLQLENNSRKTILSIERILKMWRWRNLTKEGKIIIFKTLALSKGTFLAQVLVSPNHIIDALQYSRKVKHETVSKDFQYGELKKVDIKSKIISLQCSWVKKLYDESFYEWK